MQPRDIARLVSAGTPSISPDGTTVAYTVRSIDPEANVYRSRIWIARLDGATPPRPVTSGDHRDSQPIWSPDGTWLAFTSDRPGAGSTKPESTLHLLPVTGPGETITLARGTESFDQLAFSPDGTRLAFVQRVRDARYDEDEVAKRPPRRITHLLNRIDSIGWTIDRPQHVFVVPIDGSAGPRDLTPDQRDHAQPVWIDDHALVVGGNRNPTFEFDMQEHLYRVDVASGEVAALTDGDLALSNVSRSPDGTRLAAAGIENARLFYQNLHLAVIDLTSGERQWVTRSVDRTWLPYPGGRPPIWLDDASLLGAIEDRGDVHLYRVDIGRDPRPIVTDRQNISGYDAHLDGDTLVVVVAASTFDRPAELFVYTQRDGRAPERHRLTHVTDAAVEAIAPVGAEHFVARSGDVDVDAWILRPHDFDPSRRYPALLNIHGGPFTQYSTGFFDEAQLQTRAGFVVLMSNPRGSSGRESTWGHAIQGPDHPVLPGSGWGAVDYDDVLAVVDTAIERFDFIDPSRLGVLGGSYGGYLTSWIVGHTDRFVAACSERAVNNMLSLLWQSDFGPAFVNEFGVDYLENPEAYLERSPIRYATNIRTPLLILHADDDLRCPVDQADELFAALRTLDREVEYHRFPGESHELSRSGSPAHRRQRAEIILEFFTRHLLETSD
jgi:dipeptidyl aminopeptidase/acylaminoacyl peptidase